jgi:hypothetical protein
MITNTGFRTRVHSLSSDRVPGYSDFFYDFKMYLKPYNYLIIEICRNHVYSFKMNTWTYRTIINPLSSNERRTSSVTLNSGSSYLYSVEEKITTVNTFITESVIQQYYIRITESVHEREWKSATSLTFASTDLNCNQSSILNVLESLISKIQKNITTLNLSTGNIFKLMK